ncbi:orexigenic neuropeptide QRFP [Camelus dromedarius]|uniref:orexigenic neuropeptide QRFP n=1 Tax=Camelus dromedarius TaxID=9838 RepID=UPI0031195D58
MPATQSVTLPLSSKQGRPLGEGQPCLALSSDHILFVLGLLSMQSALPPSSPPGPQWNPRARNAQQSEHTAQVHPGGLHKAWRTREPHLLGKNPEQLCPARPGVQPPSWEQARSAMLRPYSLSYVLLLPLAACSPALHREEPVDAMGGAGGETRWADLAGGRRFPWGSPGWPRVQHPLALLVMAEELQTTGRGGRAGFKLRFGRQDNGSEAAGFLPAGEKTSGPLGTLAEELSGYSRKKGGFSFRFGRR